MDCHGDKEGNGNSNEGAGQAMATATKRAMVTVMGTRVVGDEEGDGDGLKSNSDGNEGGW